MVASVSAMAAGALMALVMLAMKPADWRAIAAAMHILSNTVREGKICATWNEREIPSRVIWRDGLPVISFPSNQMLPWLGGRWPVIMLMKVVLPAPLA